MKINFEQLRVYNDIAKTNVTVMNVKMQVANDLYAHGQGIAFHALALKIYNSKGEVELDDQEYQLLMNYANQMCTPQVIDALRLYGEKKEEQ